MEAQGFQPDKIISKGGFVPQAKEMGSELGSNLKAFGKSVVQDPVKGLASPIRQMALALQFHTGRPILDSELKKQGIDQTAIDEIVSGFRKGDHQALMHGSGRLVGALGNILGGVEAPEVISDVKGVANTVRDVTSHRAIVSATSNVMLDDLRKTQHEALDNGVKAEHARIGGNVQAINIADESANKTSSKTGFKPKTDMLATVDKAVADKRAGVLLQKRMLPKVAQIRGLLEGHTSDLTFNDVKQVRTVTESLANKADGVEKAILSDLSKSLTSDLKNRAKDLGKTQEWEDYNEASRNLSKHLEGLIPELKNTKTGLEYAKRIAGGPDKPRLDALVSDLHLPKDFFLKAVKSHRELINFAKMSEGDSLVASATNRLMALKSHPISAMIGAGTGATLGRALGTAMGSPMAGSFIGLTLGAGIMHDFMSKIEASRAIRELGGPAGVMGKLSKSSIPTSGPSPQGPGGGGSPSPTNPPAGNMPPGTPPSADISLSPEAQAQARAKVSPALQKLLPINPEREVMRQPTTTSKATPEGRGGTLPPELHADLEKQAGRKLTNEEALSLDRGNLERGMATADKGNTNEIRERRRSELEKPDPNRGKTEPQVTKAPPEARGRTESARSGMTKDTPEARKAKAAEHKAVQRSEASRTNIKGSLEDQARQVAGKMDFQGKSNIELEEGLRDSFGDNGKRFLAHFKQLARQSKWSDEVYRGYLEETLTKRIEELAKRPNIPGLGTESKN
jgi:hypothetical protein